MGGHHAFSAQDPLPLLGENPDEQLLWSGGCQRGGAGIAEQVHPADEGARGQEGDHRG